MFPPVKTQVILIFMSKLTYSVGPPVIRGTFGLQIIKDIPRVTRRICLIDGTVTDVQQCSGNRSQGVILEDGGPVFSMTGIEELKILRMCHVVTCRFGIDTTRWPGYVPSRLLSRRREVGSSRDGNLAGIWTEIPLDPPAFVRSGSTLPVLLLVSSAEAITATSSSLLLTNITNRPGVSAWRVGSDE